MDATAQGRAWDWVAHLRSGGTTPWAAFETDSPAPPTTELAEAARARVPGAQNLELLRRINLASGARPTSYAEGVLRASLAGRGQPEFALSGVADRRPEIDPDEIDDEELLRVAASAIADALILGGLPDPVEPPPPRRRRRHFHLAGDPWLAIPLRRELLMAGHPTGGLRARTYVLGRPFDELVVDAWSAACFDNGPAPWETWLANWVERDRPPTRVDLEAIAERHRPRARSIEVVTDPALLRGLLGCRRQLTVPTPLAASALEAARRVAVVLGGLVSPDERTALLRGRLLPAIAGAPGPRLSVPEGCLPWARSQAGRMRATLSQAGYGVHGGWDVLTAVPTAAGQSYADRPSTSGALTTAVSLLGGEAW